MRRQRKFLPEYKEDAVTLAEKVGMSQAAKDLGIDQRTLYRWRQEKKEAEESNLKSFPGRGNPRDAELYNLRKRVADLEETNEILKKAAVIFAQKPPR
jgi:Transposase and inactivated derivatives